MYTQMLKPILYKVHKCHVEEVKHHTQKELRICDTLEPIMNRHKLIISKQALIKDRRTAMALDSVSEAKRMRYQLAYQLTRITRDRGALQHDDRLDALSMAVGHWTSLLAQDASDRMKERSSHAVDDFLKSIGVEEKSQGYSWIDTI